MGRREKSKFLPLIILSLVSWGTIIGLILLVDPEVLKNFPLKNSYFIFFLVLWFAVFFSLTLILRNTKKGLLYSLMVTMFFLLRLLRLGNVVNVMLLIGFFVVIDFYLSDG